VSELRLARATTIEEAQRVLEWFVVKFNRQFAVRPVVAEGAYCPLPADIDRFKLFSFKQERVVGNDNTVKLKGRVIQIPAGPRRFSYARAKVMVHEGMDGSVGVYYGGTRIAYESNGETKPMTLLAGVRQ